MPGKVVIFVGAPEAHTLSWAQSELIDHFLDPIATFIEQDDAPREIASDESALPTHPGAAVWRSIPLERERIRTGFSQNHALDKPYQGTPEFFTTLSRSFDTTSDLSEDEPSRQIVNQFYDHSLAIHQDIPSSQLPAASLSTNESSSLDATEDFSTTNMDGTTDYSHLEIVTAAEKGQSTDLAALPKAEYLRSIEPQTMTVNLVVGIISIAAPRVIKTRWGSTRSLIELLVADETRSGFTVTFWLPSDSQAVNTTLESLRRCDIVILRNVALGVFNNKVHGHSLRKGTTKIELLHRRRLDEKDEGGLYTMKDIVSNKIHYPQLVKTRKVATWLLNFVGGESSLGKRKTDGRQLRRWDMPPIDSQ